MATPQKKLKADARKLLDIRALFPKGSPDLRRNLTEYQAKKIRRAIREITKEGGGSLDEFIPVGTGRKKYMHDHGLPGYFKGIFLPGGTKKNDKVEYIGGGLLYERDNTKRTRFLIDATSEETVKKSIKNIWKKKAENEKAAITSDGRVIGSAQNRIDIDALMIEALYLRNKYALAAANGEMREIKNGHRNKDGTKKIVAAAHPSEWPMGVLFEPNNLGKNTYAKNKKKAR